MAVSNEDNNIITICDEVGYASCSTSSATGTTTDCESESVWKYFAKNKTKESANCKLCSNVSLKCKGSSTSGLLRHLRSKHNITISIKRPFNNIPVREAKKQTTISDYKKSPPLQELVAKMAAIDGIPFHVIENSDFIRKSLAAQGYKLSQRHGSAQEQTSLFFMEAKSTMKAELAARKEIEEKFCLSLDEYTSIANKRYLNVNIHGANSKVWNLGLLRIRHSMPAELLLRLVSARLAEFGLDFQTDIFASVTDGAQIMKKFGHLSPADYHLCYSHALHLAVSDVLYQSRSLNIASLMDVAGHSSDLFQNQEALNIDRADQIPAEGELYNDPIDDVEYEDDDEPIIPSQDSFPQREIFSCLQPTLKIEYGDLVNKVRAIVKIFRKSPLKNDKLQTYVKEQFGHELVLKIDVKTRWHTLCDMLERFLLIRQAVAKTMIDFNLSYSFTSQELSLLNALADALKVIKCAQTSMCRRDANLLTADGAIRYIFTELELLDSEINKTLASAVKKRVRERRNETLVGLLKYLRDPSSMNDPFETDFFKFPMPEELSRAAWNIMERLFFHGDDITIVEQEDEDTQLECKSLQDHLQKYDASAQPKKVFAEKEQMQHSFAMELTLFENTRMRTSRLEKLYQTLLALPPTSIESERVFSLIGLFINKLRNRLLDKTIDELYFLKSYFLANCK